MYKIFSISEAISFGFKNAIQKNYGIYIVAFLLFVALLIIQNLFSRFVYPLIWSDLEIHSKYAISFLDGLMNWILFMYFNVALTLGIYKVSLRVCDLKFVSVSQLFEYFKEGNLVLRVVLGHILLGAMIIIGFVLLIVPGIIIALMYSQFTFCMLENNSGVMEGMKMSKNLTSIKGVKSQLFVFFLALTCIGILGAIPCGIGLFFVFPLMWLSMAFVYRTLAPLKKPEGEYDTKEIVVSPGI